MYFRFQNINQMLTNQNLANLFESLYSFEPPTPLPIIILRFKDDKICQKECIMANDSVLSYRVKLISEVFQTH